MKFVSLGIVLMTGLFLAGCTHAPPRGRAELHWKFNIPPIDYRVRPLPYPIRGLDAASQKLINLDYFFPTSDSLEIWFSNDAYEAGMFDALHWAETGQAEIPSPDGKWNLLRRTNYGSVATDVLNLKRVASLEQRNFWSTGHFAEVFWSPDSRRVAVNEMRPNAVRNAFLVVVDTGEVIALDPRPTNLEGFFTADELEGFHSALVKKWVSPRSLVTWRFSDALGDDQIPLRGYELLVELTEANEVKSVEVLRVFRRK